MSRLTMDEAGWVTGIAHRASPNFEMRPEDAPIDLLVIHNISLPPGEFGGPYIDQLFQNRLQADDHPYFQDIRQLRVSAHFLIRRGGEVIQYVSVKDRAWHAGRSVWQGRENCNDFSIGIELEGADDQPFTTDQYGRLVTLTRLLMGVYPAITADRIVGHVDIAPGRKSDPGPYFDWDRYKTALAAI